MREIIWDRIELPQTEIPVNPDYDQLGDVCRKWSQEAGKAHFRGTATDMEIVIRCCLCEALQLVISSSGAITDNRGMSLITGLIDSNAELKRFLDGE